MYFIRRMSFESRDTSSIKLYIALLPHSLSVCSLICSPSIACVPPRDAPWYVAELGGTVKRFNDGARNAGQCLFYGGFLGGRKAGLPLRLSFLRDPNQIVLDDRIPSWSIPSWFSALFAL